MYLLDVMWLFCVHVYNANNEMVSQVKPLCFMRLLESCKKSDGLVYCSMQNAAVVWETVMKELHNFELVHPKWRKEENFGSLVTFWLSIWGL